MVTGQDDNAGPDQVDAIVVGIESHDGGSAFNLPGPAYDAWRMWKWLRGTGVPEERITLLISPLEEHEKDIKGKVGRTFDYPTRAAIRDAVLKRRDAAALFVYLAGHGVEVEPEKPFFMAADTTHNTPSGVDLRAAAGHLAANGPRHQMILVDACRDKEKLRVAPHDDAYPGSLVAQQDQYLLHASTAGRRTRNDDAELTGVFTRQALIALRAADRDWWTRMPEVFEALETHFEAVAEYELDQHPELWERIRNKPDRIFVPAMRSSSAGSLTVFRVPADWDHHVRALPLDERYSVSLDVLWCCNRRLRLAVLADGTGQRLVDQLNAVERDVMAPALRSLRPRTWTGIEVQHGVMPDESAMRSQFGMSAGLDAAVAAVVLRWPAVLTEDAAAYVGALRRLPWLGETCPIIVHVIGKRTVDAATAAASVARSLGLPEIAVRPAAPLEPATGGFDAHSDTVFGAADRALALVRAAASRGWLGRLPAGNGVRLTLAPAEEVDPYSVVEDLNDAPIWGDLAGEALTLCAIREFVPSLYAALLPAVAANRSDPERYTALTVAARTDAELDQWLKADWRNPVLPGKSVPRHAIDPAVAGVVTLALIRNNRSQDDILAWRDLADPVVRRVCDHHLRSSGNLGQRSADAEFLRTSDIATATAAIRAGIGGGVALSEIPGAAESAGCWRLLAGRGVDSVTARWMAKLPEGLRGLLGLEETHHEDDVQLVDDVSDLREALTPSLSGGRDWEGQC